MNGDENQQNFLQIVGCKENNLQEIDVRIPHDCLVVFAGPSGSGKSSLAFDTIFRESERRFLANLSARSSRLLARLGQPEFAHGLGFRAAIAVSQNSYVSGARSTVGTLSELGAELRLLFARFAKQICPACRGEVNQTLPPASTIRCKCGQKVPPLSRSLFSFNTPAGACPSCRGLGREEKVDPKKLVADPGKSLRHGALVPTTPTGYIVYSQVTPESMNEVCQAHGFSIDIPWQDLSPEQKDVIFFGSRRVKVAFGKHALESRMKWKGIKAKPRERGFYPGLIPVITETLKKKRNENILRFVSSHVCDSCQGTRLSKAARLPTFDGSSIAAFNKMTAQELLHRTQRLVTEEVGYRSSTVETILRRIQQRCDFLLKLGLGHLALNRSSGSLSGGESRRLKLATQLGIDLIGVNYILDEPCAGLHHQERASLAEVLRELRDQGNSVFVVEHDQTFCRQADFLIEIGPGSGRNGGELLYAGVPRESDIVRAPSRFRLPPSKAKTPGEFLTVREAHTNNLACKNVPFLLGSFNVVSGVSGAGKSSLLSGTLAPLLRDAIEEKKRETKAGLIAPRTLKHIHLVDQKPIGRSPRSNPATWSGAFDRIRSLFANTEKAKTLGFDKGRFSFNKAGGRCETCEGAGVESIGLMHMPLVQITCSACGGRRFNEETLSVTYKGHSIKAVLDFTIDEAQLVFVDKKITATLQAMQDLGLGYLTLGQPATTLSGGEAQRLKLARVLDKSSGPETVIILDEPTNGLHPQDVKTFCDAMLNLTAKGTTVIVADHDIELIKQADWLVELGPGAGPAGGRLVYGGIPAGIQKVQGSPTKSALVSPSPGVGRQQAKRKVEPRPTILEGVQTNNLKSIHVTFPQSSLTAISGVSGSGKTSLAFDTLASLGQGRFAESFSPYLRREIRAHRQAVLTNCQGVRPTIVVRSKDNSAPLTSTVGTYADIDQGLRLLFARIGSLDDSGAILDRASHFSFNHVLGSCGICGGSGQKSRCDIQKLIPDTTISIGEGALCQTRGGKSIFESVGRHYAVIEAMASHYGIDLSLPWQALSQRAETHLLDGCGSEEFSVNWEAARIRGEASHTFQSTWPGIAFLVEQEFEKKKDRVAGPIFGQLLSPMPCEGCQGERLSKRARRVLVGDWRLPQLCALEITALHDLMQDSDAFLHSKSRESSEKELAVTRKIFFELIPKLQRLLRLGLGHLTLSRSKRSLSTGESRRLEIAKQLTSGLRDVCYVLDEPGLGLHAQDKIALGQVMRELANGNNTVVFVDHDLTLLQQADQIIDMGPQSGEQGGQVVASGTPMEVARNVNSPTGKYLRDGHHLQRSYSNSNTTPGPTIEGAHLHNLRDLDFEIRFGEIHMISGVSGSGKTTLVFDVLAQSLRAKGAIGCRALRNNSDATEVFEIDGRPRGSGPMSIVATYLNIVDPLRKLFADTEGAKKRGMTRSHFSFGSKHGRCPTCLGSGEEVIALDFMPDAKAPCPHCSGLRYCEETRSIQLHGLTINQVMGMNLTALKEKKWLPKRIVNALTQLSELGLGHLTLGRRCDSLSGGESQRLKIGKELTKQRGEKPAIFLFDEPARGLHLHDQEILLRQFEKLSKKGHAVICTEHALSLIQASDRVTELGPGAGKDGGRIVFSGPPQDLLSAKTPTGRALSQLNNENHGGTSKTTQRCKPNSAKTGK